MVHSHRNDPGEQRFSAVTTAGRRPEAAVAEAVGTRWPLRCGRDDRACSFPAPLLTPRRTAGRFAARGQTRGCAGQRPGAPYGRGRRCERPDRSDPTGHCAAGGVERGGPAGDVAPVQPTTLLQTSLPTQAQDIVGQHPQQQQRVGGELARGQPLQGQVALQFR